MQWRDQVQQRLLGYPPVESRDGDGPKRGSVARIKQRGGDPVHMLVIVAKGQCVRPRAYAGEQGLYFHEADLPGPGPNRLRESIAGSGSICLAAAAQIPGSVVEAITAGRRPGELLIGHPSGITPAKVEARSGPDGVTFDVLGFSRTARRLLAGTAYYPSLEQGRTLADASGSALA
jgi:hypothetical protein